MIHSSDQLWHNHSSMRKLRTLRKILYLSPLISCLTVILWAPAGAQQNGEWPCFHGLNRDNKSLETGLLKKWPEDGPGLLWTVSGLGEGYSSVAIADGILYTAGMIEKQTFVFAFDPSGKEIWRQPNGQSWETAMPWATSYTGSRSTPTVDDGVVYHLGELGRLAAFDHRTGNPLWSIELRELFQADIPEYGYCESVFIDGEHLYCHPGGAKGFLVCLNKRDGSLVWANTDIPGTVAFSSPIVREFGGYRMIIGLSSNCVYGADSKTGKLLWSADFANDRENNITDPIFDDGYVFASTGYGKGSMLLKLDTGQGKITAESVWSTKLMDNQHGGVVLHDGCVYGDGQNARGWFCLDFMTGAQKWVAAGKGSLTYADNMLYCMEEKGLMRLVEASAGKYTVVSSFQVPSGGKGLHWTHPVVCGGRLYIRHEDKLFVYDIQDKQ